MNSLEPSTAPLQRRAKSRRTAPLWRDIVRIGLGPKWLAVAGYRRGLRPALSRKEVFVLEPAGEACPWQCAVEAVPSALALSDRKTEATVILSNHFVRYLLLPWSAALRSESEWLALARHRFLQVYGAAAEEWTIRVAPTARQGPRIASAVDKALLATLDERITASGAALVSVQPYLMAAFNRVRSTIGNESCWLVLAEPGRLTFALLQQGGWRAVRSRASEGGSLAMLPEILERESTMLGLEEPCTNVVLCTHVAPDAEACGRLHVRDLTLAGTPAGERELAMALG